MPLLRERATGAVDPEAAKRIGEALAGIQDSMGQVSVHTHAAREAGSTKAADAGATGKGAVAGAALTSRATTKVTVDDHAIPVPGEVRDAVLDLLQRFAAGESVVVGSTDSLLTTSQAAELIGISATYLLRLANDGTIPVEYRGTHRRFRLAAATEYLDASRAAKAAKAAKAAIAAKAVEAEPVDDTRRAE